MAGKKYTGTDKKVSKMTRDGLTEENLRDGSVSDISSKSRDRPVTETSEFVLEREKKKDTVLDHSDKQKQTIAKKKGVKRLTEEQAKTGRLSFEDTESQMVKGAGLGIGHKPSGAVVSTTVKHTQEALYQEDNENAAVEGVRSGTMAAEASVIGMRQAQVRSNRNRSKSKKRGYQIEELPEEKLKFGTPESLNPKASKENVIGEENRKNAINRFMQRKKYKEAYRAAKAGKSAGSLGGATKVTGMNNMTEKAKIAVKELIRRNRPLFVGIGIFILLFMIIAASLSSCTAMIQGGTSAVGIATTYASTDEDIYDAENAYCNLEEALNRQINNIESRYPGYDSYVYNVSEIGHNPYHLISFLNAKYGGFTFEEIESVIQNLFEEQYTLTTEGRTETSTETDPETGEEITVTKRVLYVTLIAKSFDVVARNNLTEDELTIYDALNLTLGNRDYLWDINTISSAGGMSYDIPPEALTDARFARMIREAEKYLGYPYVWGGSSPSTSFDCSGFVSWVINHCGNGWSYGRLTADGLRGICTYVSPSQAKPGDLIFFQGTYNTSGASHVGIYVGNGMMIHCGDPISYANVNSSYWQNHFMCYGRLP